MNCGIAAPPLPHDLARRRGPARVPDDGMEHVARRARAAPPPRRASRICPACPKTSEPNRPVTCLPWLRTRSRPRRAGTIPLASRRMPTCDHDRAGTALPRPVRRGAPRRPARGDWCAPRSTSSPHRGYHHTSVEDIVRSAHTSRTAFYAFFDNREDAMYGALQTCLRGAARHDAQQARRTRRPTRTSPRSASRAYVDCLVADPAARARSSCSKASARRPR